MSKSPAQPWPDTEPDIDILVGGGALKGGSVITGLFRSGLGGLVIGGVKVVTPSLPWSWAEQPAIDSVPGEWVSSNTKVEPSIVPTTRPSAPLQPPLP
ncbi:MAG: hypothetical protein DMF82_03690, partial [Acidobacteria bacterium]